MRTSTSVYHPSTFNVNHLFQIPTGSGRTGKRKSGEVVTDEYQEFYERWRNTSTGSNFPNKFPYKLSLGVDSHDRPLLPFYSGRTSGNQILVTEAYDDMFHHLLYRRWNDKGRTAGAVLTGQPGIGVPL